MHVHRPLDFFCGDAVQYAGLLGVVQGVEYFLADVYPVQGRHGDVYMTCADQFAEVFQEQGAEQGGDMQAVGIRIGQDADTAVAQLG